MSTKHTPGPWKQNKYGRIVGTDGETVTTTGLALICGYRPEDDQAFANALLIAAAPELLEALRAIVECHEVESGMVTDGHINAARAAIAKAEGEQQ